MIRLYISIYRASMTISHLLIQFKSFHLMSNQLFLLVTTEEFFIFTESKNMPVFPLILSLNVKTHLFLMTTVILPRCISLKLLPRWKLNFTLGCYQQALRNSAIRQMPDLRLR